ncbi:MAG: hypothetical protein KBD57_09900 [Bacteroidia bacterium]|nr:hypothetical protein [Bacteroidia bacterium]
MEVLLNGKRAVKVNAKMIIWGKTDKAKKYNIDGDEKWVPISLSKFERTNPNQCRGDLDGVLTIEEWFYKKLFPEG